MKEVQIFITVLQTSASQQSPVCPVHVMSAAEDMQVLSPLWCNIPLGITSKTAVMSLQRLECSFTVSCMISSSARPITICYRISGTGIRKGFFPPGSPTKDLL